MPIKPTGLRPPAGPARRAVASVHASQHSATARYHLTPLRTKGLSRITLPRPKVTMNIIIAVPMATPKRLGRPRSTPTFAPVVVKTTLLGPGVPAAAIENAKKVMARPSVISTDPAPLRGLGWEDPHAIPRWRHQSGAGAREGWPPDWKTAGQENRRSAVARAVTCLAAFFPPGSAQCLELNGRWPQSVPREPSAGIPLHSRRPSRHRRFQRSRRQRGPTPMPRLPADRAGAVRLGSRQG